MKEVPDRTGRFSKRPHYEIGELDQECESIISTFLRKKYGAVRYPVSTDDLTVLLEQYVADLDLYADLTEFGTNVEGVTVFSRRGKPSVRIDAGLVEDSSRENRLRTTLTHEFGHVYFHAYLWQDKSLELDFGNGGYPAVRNASDIRQVCKRATMLNTSNDDWMEWQAGHVCGAILMPASKVKQLSTQIFSEMPSHASVTESTALGAKLIHATQDSFSVSTDAARVRLLRLGLLTAAKGGSLF